MRNCDIALRWRLLHRKTKVESFRKIVENSMNTQAIVALLLNTSQFEFQLKERLQQLLSEKDQAWTTGKDSVADRFTELSEYFTGEKALTRVKRDESLMRYFAELSNQVKNLTLEENTEIFQTIITFRVKWIRV
jgi:WASH complex subunit strumpellin